MVFLQENGKLRPKYFSVRGRALKVPVYFPSVSSIKTGLSPFDYFKILQALGHPQFLISAFDVDKSVQKSEFIEGLKHNKLNDGAVILMDSGNYESFWIRDKDWNIRNVNGILGLNLCDLAFCFDNQSPSTDVNDNASYIANSTKQSQQVVKTTSVFPIVHSSKERIVDTVLKVREQLNFSLVAIPERILGNGLLERVRTVTQLRRELNKKGEYLFIHLLGTGNPLSLLLFSLAGADSFDGLEWCQTVVDTKTALLYHFQQRELILDNCAFCQTSELDYNLTTLGHNLLFYNSWMQTIQAAIESNSEMDLLGRYFDSNFISDLSKIWA